MVGATRLERAASTTPRYRTVFLCFSFYCYKALYIKVFGVPSRSAFLLFVIFLYVYPLRLHYRLHCFLCFIFFLPNYICRDFLPLRPRFSMWPPIKKILEDMKKSPANYAGGSSFLALAMSTAASPKI